MSDEEKVTVGAADVGFLADAAVVHGVDAYVAAIAEEINAGGAVTREAAKLFICHVPRTCRGAIAGITAAALGDDGSKEIEVSAADVKLAITEHLKAGRMQEARDLDTAARVPCGYDFNSIVLSGPLDGREHAYTCPRCGVQGAYRAPLIHISDSPQAA